MNFQTNLDYLKVFFYAAKYQNITRAAQELFLTQPAATRVLHLLEAQLECQLFIRSSRGVTLTPEGDLLYQELIPVFEGIETAHNKLVQMKSLENGFIHVGCNNLAAEYILHNLLHKFYEMYPGITITTSRVGISHLDESLQNGWIDFAISIDIGNQHSSEDTLEYNYLLSKRIKKTEIGVFTDAFLVGPRYAYMSKQLVSMNELSALPLIVPIKQRSSVLYYTNLLRKDGRLSDSDMTVNGAESRLALAKRNLGLTYFPSAFVQEELSKKQLFCVNTDTKMQNNTISILTSEKKSLTLAATRLFEMLSTEKTSG